MRQLGHLKDEAAAQAFSDYLYVQGITNEVEAESGGWVVWVHEEEQIPKAQELLKAFLANSQDPKYYQHSREAQRLKEREEQEEAEAERRHFDRRRVFRGGFGGGVGVLTFALIAVCVIIYILMQSESSQRMILQAMYITTARNGLPEIMSGELWRLITPAFVHERFLHIFFNMLWLFDLGSMIERRQGAGFLLLFVVITAALSNLGQWYMNGPYFYGMSGVVYALLGYIWMKGKYDPASGLFLHPQTVTMMLIWFFLCLIHIIPGIANTAHGVGLVAGMAWGFAASRS